MELTMNISHVRTKLLDLADTLGESSEVLQVTRRGKPVLAVIPWEVYESITETLEVVSDAGLMTAIREDLENPNRSDLLPWEEVKKELGF